MCIGEPTPVVLPVHAARCDCRPTFRNSPEGILPRAWYDDTVRDLVLDRVLLDGMRIEWTMESMRREFLLDLSGFVYDVLQDRARPLDSAEYRPTILERFTLLRATDPLADLPVERTNRLIRFLE